jgi:hypothetical protein
MPNPYAQVALTYYRHFRASARWWALIGIVIVYLNFCVLFVLNTEIRMSIMLGLGFPLLCLVAHIREQFLDARSHLMPNFRRAHAVVAVAAVLIATVLFPLLLTLLSGSRSISIVSCFTITFSIIIWACFGKSLLLFAIPVFVIAACTETGALFFVNYFTGKHEPLAYGLALYGLASSLWGLFKLFRVTDEDPAYQKLQASRIFKAEKAGQNVDSVPLLSKGSTDRLMDRHIARLSAHARRASASRWSRIGRWQLGINLAMILRISMVTSFMTVVMHFTMHGKQTLFMLGFIVSFIPITMAGTIRQTHRLSRELLLPIDRPSYIRQMGINAAINIFAAWAVAWGFLVLLYVFLLPNSYSAATLGYLTLISALMQALFFGILVWIARHDSKLWYILALFVPVYLQIGLMAGATVWNSPSAGPTMVLIAAVAAVFGLLIAYDAHRRWLVADIAD